MFKNLLAFVAILTMLFPASSFAENSPLYINMNAARFDSKHADYDVDGGIVGLGWDLNNYIAMEVAGGLSEKYEDATIGLSDKIDYVASAYLRLNLRFNRVTMYVMGGYSKAKSSSTIGSTTTITESDGTSYGYGIDFYGTRDLALSVRRIEFIDIDDATTTTHLGATMLGITYYYDTPKMHSRY